MPARDQAEKESQRIVNCRYGPWGSMPARDLAGKEIRIIINYQPEV